jgi:cell division transport system permease protein
MFKKNKNVSSKSKPSQFMAILGITSVLFIVGIFGWLFLSATKYTEVLKEDVLVQVYLHSSATDKTTTELKNYIESKPYIKDIEYVDKATAKQRLQASEDKYDEALLGSENPLVASINFHLKNNYVQKDSLDVIKSDIQANSNNIVESILYPERVVEKMGPILKWVLIGLLVLAIIFGLLAIILIDNTIKLSMYSNRFLIKTMQMVGATRGFIVKPINKQAIINGLVASIIAILFVCGLVYLAENSIADVKQLRDNQKLLFLFSTMIFLGVIISLVSTHRSVIKYLKMKLDDLY